MLAYVLRRLAHAAFVVAGVSVIVFMMLHLVPGNPVLVMLAQNESVASAGDLEHQLGLDQPLYTQYYHYVDAALHGDLGRSIRLQLPVTTLIEQRVWNTLELAVAALTIAIVVGVPLGTIAAVKRARMADYGVTVVALVGVSIPTFFLGILLILLFGVRWAVLPIAGNEEGAKSLVLPAITLATIPLATISRLTRSSLLNTLGEDHVRVARAKGLPYRTVVLRHGLRNSLIPIVTIVGVQFGALLGGRSSSRRSLPGQASAAC